MGKMFSIIVPTYNRPSELVSCLISLENQKYKDFEVVVVDDCSTITSNINHHFSYKLTYHRLKVNLGAAGARNFGSKLAKGEWLVFLDDDDIFEPEKLETLYDTISKNFSSEIIYHTAKINMVNEGLEYVTSVRSHKKLILHDLLENNYVGGAPVLTIKKSLFTSVGGFSEKLRSIEDYHLLLKLSAYKEVNISFIDKPLTSCFYYTKRISVSKNIKNLDDSLKVISEQYVTDNSFSQFKINSYLMIAHAQLMSLSRKSGFYYFKAFRKSLTIKYLFASIVSIISPKLLICLRARF